MSQAEFFSFPHVVSIGRRRMVLPPDEPQGKKRRDHEVYVRLVSGNTFALAHPLTRKQAGRIMHDHVRNMAEATGCTFVTTEDAAIPFEHVARVYVDGQENECVALLEDSSAATYPLERGSAARCRQAVEIVAQAILQYIEQRKEDT